MFSIRRAGIPSFVLLFGGALFMLLVSFASPGIAADRSTVSFRTVEVGSPGNPSVSIVPFTDAIYETCADAPEGSNCMDIGDVDYRYGIGRLEITVGQWVKFLNKVDPKGRNRHRLYAKTQSSGSWPEYGQVNKKGKARPGRKYRVASSAWSTKPYAFAALQRHPDLEEEAFQRRIQVRRLQHQAFPDHRARHVQPAKQECDPV